MPASVRLLLVEDNARLSDLIVQRLGAEGFAVDPAFRVGEAEEAMRAAGYDGVILDLGLPDGDGMDLLAAERRRGAAMPFLIVTSREGRRGVVDGLNGGADDYLLKPFEMDELVARVRALLRRPGQPLNVVLRHGNIELDTVARRVRIGDADTELSRRELAALEHLVRHRMRIASKAELERALYAFDAEVSANAIEVLIHRLRRKLAAAGASAEIHTLRGIGYILSDRAP